MAGTLTIKLRTAKEDITPLMAAKQHKYAPGFAEAVQSVKGNKQHEAPWSWCTVDVIAEYRMGDQIIEGRDSLGGCSYFNAADFICNSMYFDDMVKSAIADLKKQLVAANLFPKTDDKARLVEELISIISDHGPGHLGNISVQQLRKALERPDMIGKAAQRAWDSCMRTPEILAKLPPDKKARASTIITELGGEA